ncbi:hypothetical protein BTW15_02650 [Pseudomonas syringae pv. tomato]|uniref:DUF1652 domain-containing protein n=2 Tax=Pseudomonas syringae group genomosp. 3 TaxID=251701 RepID=A0AB36KZS3_PSEUB|nr:MULTISPECIES: DUF1652 domain-containing protein [Pseudomonas]KPW50439.1 Prophage PssSM-02, Orf25 [Pseudomonas syringae pv. antirrhini]MBI6847407.1 DUF1652 domain-containing protein [Pseudomonas syringae]MBX6509452.1 DUF1652 domain-containing protein [Pseudomonas syringae pv. tomato]OPE61608.1 hypothetical protein BTW15_02650 [Pseudomonas syringae pv. tomato]RMP40242.1 Prophage PssSM-02, Orf25 [Pseudomonas syringae pv. antirrhini]
MTSSMDLRPIIEAAFLPMTCVCDFAQCGSMTIRISDPASEAEEFTVTGIDTTALVTIRDIVGLILEVKGEMRLRLLASDRQERVRKA